MAMAHLAMASSNTDLVINGSQATWRVENLGSASQGSIRTLPDAPGKAQQRWVQVDAVGAGAYCTSPVSPPCACRPPF